MLRRAVILATARTPIAKAFRGAFNHTQALAGRAIASAVGRAAIDPATVDDVILGAAMQVGSTGGNIAQQALMRAGLPVSIPGMSIDRAGGVESISLVCGAYQSAPHAKDPFLVDAIPEIYIPMLETAEVVA